MARVCLIYLGQKYKTLNVLNELGLSWKSAEKKHFARDSIDQAYSSIDQARLKVTNTSTATRFQLYIQRTHFERV